jgi:DNA-binding transcriptional LysR family regulator
LRSARHGEPKHPAGLRDHNCLVYTGFAGRNVWAYQDAEGGSVVVTVSGNLESNSADAIRQAVCEGIGVSHSTLWIFGEDLRAGRVRAVLQEYRARPLPLNVVLQPARRPSLKVKSFVDFFAAAFRSDPDISPMMDGPAAMGVP